MNEKLIQIKKIIATVDEVFSYTLDVNAETTLLELKTILSSAAHLLKNSFKIYAEEKELENDFDKKTMEEIFADRNPIRIKVITLKNANEQEDQLIEINLNVKSQCLIHEDKFKIFYCESCKKSICMKCYKMEHSNQGTYSRQSRM